jgi:hypothetical protein
VDSPYLAKLRAALDSTQDEIEVGAVRAEIAAYLARVGEFDTASQIIEDLKAEFADGRSGRVAILRMCAEGLVAYFRDMDPASLDRFLRAQALSIAGRSPSLIAYTSAWLSFVAFNLQRHEQMARAIAVGMGVVGPQDKVALARFAVSIADTHMLVGNHREARAWYERVRALAAELGDHTAMSAQILNSAIFGAFACRVEAVSNTVSPERLRLVTRDVKNALNYRALTNIRALAITMKNAWASVLILSNAFREADSVLSELIADRSAAGPKSNVTSLQCDSIRCQASYVKDYDIAAALDPLDEVLLAASAADDRAVACAALRDASVARGRSDLAQRYGTRALEALAEYEVQLAQLRSLAADLPDTAAFDRARAG